MNNYQMFTLFLGISISVPHVILAHFQDDFRCSHQPPPQDQVSHIRLDDSSFSALDQVQSSSNETAFVIVDDHKPRVGGNKQKRQIDFTNDPTNIDHAFNDTAFGVLKRTGTLQSPHAGNSNGNDLVPMRIQVYYDASVSSLEKQKRELITNLVMPTVVKFFENVLSIRREHTIDKFRIARRCPGNIIYYARDKAGLFRPYCMDRCENYAICGEMKVPASHLSACSHCNNTTKRCTTDYSTQGQGLADTQLLLYVSANQTARCRRDQTIAYAAHCAQDAKTDRPVAGHANLCPSSISTDQRDLKALIATVKHELTHVLGFSVSLFAYYRDDLGRPLTDRDSNPGPITVNPKTGYAKWSDRVIKKVIRPGWVTGMGKVNKEVHMMVTPTVVREVRRHFNCSSLEGAELEDQGSDGTSMTHWEKRLFENEAMTGTHTQNSVYSRLTLAALQDTGWYVANFNRADRLEWGKDLGCDFAQKSCKSWISERREKNLSIRPFCDRVKTDLLQIACTEDRASKAVCNMKQYKDPLPMSYRNFDYIEGIPSENLSYYGGSVDLADYCPFIQEFTWQSQNVTVRGSRCDLGGNNMEPEKNAALEHYGAQTKCFEHGRRWEQRSCIFKRHWHHFGAGCYKYLCSDGHVRVIVGNHSYPCYYPNQLIHVQQIVDHWLYNGTIVCPACEKVCSGQKCESHDRGLVDRILNFIVDHTFDNEINKPEDYLDAFLEVSSNSIDIDLSTRTKTKPVNLANQSFQIQYLDLNHPSYKEYLLQLFSHHRHPARQYLACSSGNSDYRSMTTASILTWILSSILISTLVMPRRG